VGIALIVVSTAAPIGYKHWLATRTFVPLDMPVSLSPGHIKTADFYINLKQLYYIDLRVDSPFGYLEGCQLWGPASVAKARLTLFRDGKMLGQAEGANYRFPSFYADKEGLYSLDIEVLSDASCLNAGHPRIAVETDPSYYDELLMRLGWLSVTFIAPGLGLLARSIQEVIGKRVVPPKGNAASESHSQHYQWSQKLPLKQPFSGLPAFGLLATLTILVVVIPLWVMQSSHRMPRGLYVGILKPGPLATESGPRIEPIVVRIAYAGIGAQPQVYVNLKLVSWDRLGSALKGELKLRPDWVVYLQADNRVAWADAVNAMDIAKGMHAKVVLLTPKSAEDVERDVGR
jgi:biopolymer transport protein ExbD/TolR